MNEVEQSFHYEQLLRGLTHKMNNILSLFHGYLGMLMEDKKLDPMTQSALESIQEGAVQASALMDRTQAIVRQGPASLLELDLQTIVSNAKPNLDALTSRGIQLLFLYPGNAKVLSDVARLRSILSEIVANAIEASPNDAIVRVETSVEGERAIISVSNSGPEISAEIMKKVFDPFFTTRQKRSAFGLGLPLVLAIARNLNAAVTLERINDQTVCKISLPLAGK